MNRWHHVTRLWPWLAAISSGLLYAACFAPVNQTWLCWVCLTPLIAAIWFSGGNSKRPWLRHIALGYVAGLTFFWSVLSWLTTVTVPGWILLQFYMAVYFAFWGWLCGMIRPRPLTPAPTEGEPEGGTNGKWNRMLQSAGRPPATRPRLLPG